MHVALVHYDLGHRRLWLHGQRCHHGATGALLAGAGVAAAFSLSSRRLAAVVVAGTLLMAHDWKDRAVWFARGSQD